MQMDREPMKVKSPSFPGLDTNHNVVDKRKKLRYFDSADWAMEQYLRSKNGEFIDINGKNKDRENVFPNILSLTPNLKICDSPSLIIE